MIADREVPGLRAYLVVDPRGGPPYATINRDRAYELARNTGCVVSVLPVVTDDSTTIRLSNGSPE